jgi:hypothetical protein
MLSGLILLTLSPGSLGAPDNPQKASENLNIETVLGPRKYPVLNIERMTKAKFSAFCSRASTTDHMDVVFLIQNFADGVIAACPQLNEEHRRGFAKEYSRRNRGPGNFARVLQVKQLLGLEE